MSSVPTLWGYDIALADGQTSIPPILTGAEFVALTGSALSPTSDAVQVAVAAVSQAVRNFCGWHISPALDCEADFTADGKTIVMPALIVNSISKVVEDGVELSDGQYEFQRRGLLRRCAFRNWTNRWGGVHVKYNAGIADDGLLKQVVAQIAANHLAASPGVREEHVGDEGITYNETAAGVSGGVTLLSRDMAVLAPYRLAGVLR